MKKVALLSHCILNPFCEFEEPAAKELYREIVKRLMDEDIGILQLPCPELTYQGLERTSIVPGGEGSNEYTKFCRDLVSATVENIKEYKKNGIKVGAILGIDTSPSCSAIDESAFMTKELFEIIGEEGIEIKKIDVPVVLIDEREKLIENILAMF